MPGLPVALTQPQERQLCDGLPDVLHAPGAEHVPAQVSGGRDAGAGGATPRGHWPGRSLGVRAPDVGETPLSYGEVEVGIDAGLLARIALEVDDEEADGMAAVRILRPAGSWERRNAGALARPTPWEGLARA